MRHSSIHQNRRIAFADLIEGDLRQSQQGVDKFFGTERTQVVQSFNPTPMKPRYRNGAGNGAITRLGRAIQFGQNQSVTPGLIEGFRWSKRSVRYWHPAPATLMPAHRATPWR